MKNLVGRVVVVATVTMTSAARLMAQTQVGTIPASVPAATKPHSVGNFNISINWRLRVEAWDFFDPGPGQHSYTFGHSLLRLGIGQKTKKVEWLVEGAVDDIFHLPSAAVEPAPAAQLGLGGTYFAANGSVPHAASAFLKQAYVDFRLPGNGHARIGRFTFQEGAEVQPKDKALSTLINTRVAQRLIGDFGFSAVQRSFDGVQIGFTGAKGHATFFAARPTQGVFQVRGMDELDVTLLYGAVTVPRGTPRTASDLRVFAIEYLDDRRGVLKTDNRPLAARQADGQHIRVETYGANYAHVRHTDHHGQLDFLVWGALQTGVWGAETHRAGAFVGEFGWQPPIHALAPWFSAGYSYGSGDSNPTDATHGTFFQVLPTPRLYDRFPFLNLMNNEDVYGTVVLRFPHAIAVRSEVHALRLARAQDLWYAGGGAFQPNTFGFTGRASGGTRSLANTWDVSVDVPLRAGFSLTTYFAQTWGKGVVATSFPQGTRATFGYAELNFRF